MPETLFDPDTGEVVGEGKCDRCVSSLAQAAQAEIDLRNLEGEMRRLRRANAALKAEVERRQEASGEARIARALFRYWVMRCEKDKGRTKFGEKRQKAVIARLRNDYSPAYIARAIDGAADNAFVSEGTGIVYNDLELICRDEPHLERFHELAERAGAKTYVGPAWLHEFEGSEVEVDADDTFGA